ncbi:hypothetical protein [Pseudonocardia oceani]|uniref:hypothetical protein n=1 Tax=Pseudonocardia oceani TaxID=2792013 RepID=UPI003555E7BD
MTWVTRLHDGLGSARRRPGARPGHRAAAGPGAGDAAAPRPRCADPRLVDLGLRDAEALRRVAVPGHRRGPNGGER